MLLELEGVEEGAHMGHPDFSLGGRIFASLMADGVRASVKLAPEEQSAFVEESPRTFAPAAGAWGRQGWTTIQLPGAPEAMCAAPACWRGRQPWRPRPARPRAGVVSVQR